MKLEEIVGYLPHKLKIMSNVSGICTLDIMGQTMKIKSLDCQEVIMYKAKPILRNLSDLTKPITVDGYNDGKEFVPIEELKKDMDNWDMDDYNWFFNINIKDLHQWNNKDTGYLPYMIIQLLYQWQFDIHGLIKRGEAIDINTLEEK